MANLKNSDRYLFRLMDCDLTLKFNLLGDSSVGKTSLLGRYIGKEFESNYVPSIGMDFTSKNIEINGKTIKLAIWDTAGQESFKSLTKTYLRDSNGVILAFDLTKQCTFENIPGWVELIDTVVKDTDIILVGCKSDLIDERSVSDVEINKIIRNRFIGYYESSAKNGFNINNIFEKLAREAMENYHCDSNTVKFTVVQQDNQSRCC